ncbi:MAG: hypothetical protein L0229_02640, partial [Blastocatellia bacterium]|nr:hypothetical protein [Blastocatellia bacterium]
FFFLQRFLSSGGALDSAEVRQKLKLHAAKADGISTQNCHLLPRAVYHSGRENPVPLPPMIVTTC